VLLADHAFPGMKEDAWREYYTYGGLPRVLELQTHQEKADYLKKLFHNTYLKDVMERYDIRNNEEVLNDLLNIIASSIGALSNPSRLSNTFKSAKHKNISSEAIRQYLTYFEEAYLIQEAKRYDVKGRKYIDTPLKYYFTDMGLRNSWLNYSQLEENHIMENIIYNELRYRGFSVDVGTVYVNELTDQINLHGNLMYRRKELEVDFVANSSKGRFYVQSCLNISDEETLQREIRSLTAIPDSFRKIIVTRDGLAPRQNENGVLILDIFDFLMDADLMYQ
jgi:predicted AAA+ superfamily ATPase